MVMLRSEIPTLLVQYALTYLRSAQCNRHFESAFQASKMSEASVMDTSFERHHEYTDHMRDLLNDVVSRLSSVGLSVHVIRNKVLLSRPGEDGEAFAIVDGKEALKFVNQPESADKIICVGSERYYCHSEYLSLRSEYFRALLKGDFKETSMDIVKVLLPAPGNFEPILRYLYSGLADASLFSEEEIFRTIQNSNFLGIECLLSKTVEVFAQKWKVLAKSPLFKRSLVASEFVVAVLDYGSKENLFKEGDKLRIAIQWNEESGEPDNFPETKRLLLKQRCLDSAGIADLEWAIAAKDKLFASLDQADFRVVYRRASQEYKRAQEKIRASEDKVKGLLQCVQTLTTKLEEVRCSRCHVSLPRAALKSRTCVALQHPGEYVVNRGWSCCGELIKRTRGCKPVSVSRHRVCFRS